jgi:GT2 family glycosyltransferase
MAISRRAWNTLGPFDAEAFGRGYCEETDWCLRAGAAGWSTRLVPDLFVFHKHGGSFLDRERRTLLEANLATLHRRWPDYYAELARFRRRDPWAVYRAAAMLALTTEPGPARGVSILQRRGSGPIQAELRLGHWRSALLVETAEEALRLKDNPRGVWNR